VSLTVSLTVSPSPCLPLCLSHYVPLAVSLTVALTVSPQDAAVTTTPDGTAGSSATLQLRAEATTSGGKCWSVDDARNEMTSPSSPPGPVL
jgi:hypothetical protein